MMVTGVSSDSAKKFLCKPQGKLSHPWCSQSSILCNHYSQCALQSSLIKEQGLQLYMANALWVEETECCREEAVCSWGILLELLCYPPTFDHDLGIG